MLYTKSFAQCLLEGMLFAASVVMLLVIGYSVANKTKEVACIDYHKELPHYKAIETCNSILGKPNK